VVGRCPAHQQLVADPLHWTNQIRATALDVAAGGVWIEQVKFRTTPASRPDDAMLGDGPLGELVQYVNDLRGDDEQLLRLGEELKDFEHRLPDELKRGPDAMALHNVDQLRAVLDEAEPLLVDRLLARESTP
jgi:hypothetical protein